MGVELPLTLAGQVAKPPQPGDSHRLKRSGSRSDNKARDSWNSCGFVLYFHRRSGSGCLLNRDDQSDTGGRPNQSHTDAGTWAASSIGRAADS